MPPVSAAPLPHVSALILFLTADWARCRDGCEEDTEEEQQECDQEDQGVLLLQVGQPAGLAAIFNFIQPVGRVSFFDNFTARHQEQFSA